MDENLHKLKLSVEGKVGTLFPLETLLSIAEDNMVSRNSRQRANRLKTVTDKIRMSSKLVYPLGRKKKNERERMNKNTVEDAYFVYGTKIVTKEEAITLRNQGEYVMIIQRTRGGAKTTQLQANEKRLKLKRMESTKKVKRTGQMVRTGVSDYVMSNTLPEPKIRVKRAKEVRPQPQVGPLPEPETFDFVDVQLPQPQPEIHREPVPVVPQDPVPNNEPPPPPEPPVMNRWRFVPPEPEPIPPPVLPGIDLTMQSFEYEQHERWLIFFSRRKTMKGHLPKAVILALKPKISKINAVQFMSYEELLKSDATVQLYDRYYLNSSVEESVKFGIMCVNFWYAYAKLKADQGYRLSRANSKYSET